MLQLRIEDVTWQQLEGEMVVLDLRSSTYMKLNATASTLWKLLIQPTTRDDLVTALKEDHGADDEQAATDADAFLADLEDRGLLINDA